MLACLRLNAADHRTFFPAKLRVLVALAWLAGACAAAPVQTMSDTRQAIRAAEAAGAASAAPADLEAARDGLKHAQELIAAGDYHAAKRAARDARARAAAALATAQAANTTR